MLNKIVQRLSQGKTSWDPVAYWRGRASGPDTTSVMWSNRAYNELADRDEWDVIARHLPERASAVLDLGCGTGRMSQRLAARFDSYTGVDIDTMIAEAARRNPQLAERFLEATVEDYAFPEAAFDLVLTIGVLATACSTTSLDRVAAQIARSLRSGGRVVMLEGFHERQPLTRGCRTTPRKVADVFEEHGLRRVTVDGMLFFPARMVLSEELFGRFPRLTQAVYRAGERLVKLRPSLLADYGIVVLTKP